MHPQTPPAHNSCCLHLPARIIWPASAMHVAHAESVRVSTILLHALLPAHNSTPLASACASACINFSKPMACAGADASRFFYPMAWRSGRLTRLWCLLMQSPRLKMCLPCLPAVLMCLLLHQISAALYLREWHQRWWEARSCLHASSGC